MKKILLVNQFSQLDTGYGIYGNHLLNLLVKDYEVAELACEANQAKVDKYNLPWKVYANTPTDPHQLKTFEQNPQNDFGYWKFHETCLDFQPDVVLCLRDIWMERYIMDSPYSNYFDIVYMAAIDAEGQEKEWLDYYNRCNLLTYQNWSSEQVLKEGGIKTVGFCPFCVSE